jgi:hypothetical protein
MKMFDFARLPLAERSLYFQETANRRGLTKLIVEMDFWVCYILKIIFGAPELADVFVFKGGTCLSKVFGIIKRFSEDVDLSIGPVWLGFDDQDAVGMVCSRSGVQKKFKKMERACIDAVRERICNILEEEIVKTLGPRIDSSRYLNFLIDSQTGSPLLELYYPTDQDNVRGYILPKIKLEFGSLTDQRPVGMHSVTSWVAEEFPSAINDAQCPVVALDAQRSFWEKATILHAEYHRPLDKSMRSRLSRDCYDLVCMGSHESGKRALADRSLLERVVRFKQTYFYSSWANYESAKPGTLRIVPPQARLREVKSDYEAMQPMFYETPPAFEKLMDQLAELEKGINQP